jgi:hypothetical protein
VQKIKKWNDSFGIGYIESLSLAEYKLLHRLMTYADSQTGELYPSTSRLAREMHMDRRNVQRLMQSLKDKNFVFETGTFKNQVKLLCLNLDEQGFISDSKRINRGTDTPGSEYRTPPGSGDAPTRGLVTHPPGSGDAQNYNITINKTFKGTGGAKKSPQINKTMAKKNLLREKLNVPLKDLPSDLDLRGLKSSTKKWNATHLINLWNSTCSEILGNTVEPHSGKNLGYFNSQVEKCGIDMADIAEAMEVVIDNWSGFHARCVRYGVPYPPKEPNFKFFAKCINYAVDFTKEFLKPVEEKKMKIYYPDGTIISSETD